MTVWAAAVRVMDAREREVLLRHYGLQGRPLESLTQIGRSLGVTRQMAHKILNRALRKLTERMDPKEAAALLSPAGSSWWTRHQRRRELLRRLAG